MGAVPVPARAPPVPGRSAMPVRWSSRRRPGPPLHVQAIPDAARGAPAAGRAGRLAVEDPRDAGPL